ncbi:MAG: hypothetical protein LKJ44_05060 [Bifidobacteriaceae bacterium]|jgi:hypothetical protein|nr:hypothetical protein [Bifidobacteriaceae bacterium]MCI1979067.1 hypothetical protein [Bifidobacteriaceae bacterium]
MSASTRPAEAGRTVSSVPQHPRLRVIEGSKRRSRLSASATVAASHASHVRPMVQVMAAIAFLAVSLVGSLLLRTQMVQDSFEITQVQNSIGVLTQDVQDGQTKLDTLESSLPEKAEKLGMKPQSTSVVLDLSEYIKQQSAAQKN